MRTLPATTAWSKPAAVRGASRLGAVALGLLCSATLVTACSDRPPAVTEPTVAPAGAYPFFVQVRSESGYLCAAVLTEPAKVLTAAHCVSGTQPTDLTVAIGRTELDDDTQGELRRVAQIRLHPSWKAGSAEYDLAMLRLDQPSAVEPIALADASDYPADTRVLAMGHLLTEGAFRSGQLRYVELDLRSDQYLGDPGVFGERFNPDVMVGAGSPPEVRNFCAGDRGGPLVVSGPSGHRLIGVAGRERGCLVRPALFAEVAGGPLREWLTTDVPPGLGGHVLADRPTQGSYKPTSSLNTAGETNTVTRLGSGTYQVSFGGLGDGVDGGVAQVTGFRSTCRVGEVERDDTVLRVGVRCNADATFALSFARPGGEGPYAHVLLDARAEVTQSYNSGGAQNSARRAGPGDYVVSLPELGSLRGTVKVTPYGGGNARCTVLSWPPPPNQPAIQVRCFGPSGAPADSPFALTYSNGPAPVPTPGARWGWILADRPTSNKYFAAEATSFNSAGGIDTILRLRTGSYRVQLGDLQSRPSVVHVTAIGSRLLNCLPDAQRPVDAGMEITIACTDAAGAATDAEFVLQLQA